MEDDKVVKDYREVMNEIRRVVETPPPDEERLEYYREKTAYMIKILQTKCIEDDGTFASIVKKGRDLRKAKGKRFYKLKQKAKSLFNKVIRRPEQSRERGESSAAAQARASATPADTSTIADFLKTDDITSGEMWKELEKIEEDAKAREAAKREQSEDDEKARQAKKDKGKGKLFGFF